MAIRMVPFESISERLYPIVRQTCKEMDKEAKLELHGREVEIDHGVLDKMTAPLEHMLRKLSPMGWKTRSSANVRANRQ